MLRRNATAAAGCGGLAGAHAAAIRQFRGSTARVRARSCVAAGAAVAAAAAVASGYSTEATLEPVHKNRPLAPKVR